MSERTDDELVIERVAREVRSPVHLDAAFDARVMAAVRATRLPLRRRRVLAGMLRQRRVMLSPIGALALAAGFAGVVAASTLALYAPATKSVTPAARGAAGAVPATRRLIQFVLTAPSASRVALAGDFNGWSTTATLLRRAPGANVWSVSVPLAPGRHAYAFVVDDSVWVADPAAPRAPENDFGPPNSVVTVYGASL
ncbi:MAG TPA: isoamylase early set domain-containing protein [Gemmatimonadaceae bacterium]|nr:isoamylase early set domain-containing protein [Gemmatimonadaceae bacterium]